jgi:hypothetical protein
VFTILFLPRNFGWNTILCMADLQVFLKNLCLILETDEVFSVGTVCAYTNFLKRSLGDLGWNGKTDVWLLSWYITIFLGSEETSVINRKEKKCREEKVVANRTFAVASVWMFCSWQGNTVLLSLHFSGEEIRRCCQGNVTTKQRYVPRLREATMKVRKAQH